MNSRSVFSLSLSVFRTVAKRTPFHRKNYIFVVFNSTTLSISLQLVLRIVWAKIFHANQKLFLSARKNITRHKSYLHFYSIPRLSGNCKVSLTSAGEKNSFIFSVVRSRQLLTEFFSRQRCNHWFHKFWGSLKPPGFVRRNDANNNDAKNKLTLEAKRLI